MARTRSSTLAVSRQASSRRITTQETVPDSTSVACKKKVRRSRADELSLPRVVKSKIKTPTRRRYPARNDPPVPLEHVGLEQVITDLYIRLRIDHFSPSSISTEDEVELDTGDEPATAYERVNAIPPLRLAVVWLQVLSNRQFLPLNSHLRRAEVLDLLPGIPVGFDPACDAIKWPKFPFRCPVFSPYAPTKLQVARTQVRPFRFDGGEQMKLNVSSLSWRMAHEGQLIPTDLDTPHYLSHFCFVVWNKLVRNQYGRKVPLVAASRSVRNINPLHVLLETSQDNYARNRCTANRSGVRFGQCPHGASGSESCQLLTEESRLPTHFTLARQRVAQFWRSLAGSVDPEEVPLQAREPTPLPVLPPTPEPVELTRYSRFKQSVTGMMHRFY